MKELPEIPLVSIVKRGKFVMPKSKRKLTTVEKQEKKERQKNFETIFINGKQVRMRRPPTIDGIPVDEFIANNADPIWLHQNEMWEDIDTESEND